MPREIVAVRVVREGAGSVRDGYGGYTEAGEVEIDGSPFDARLFRASDVGFSLDRHATGETLQEKRRVLTFLDPVTARAIREGNTAIVPPCVATGGKELRASVRRVKHFLRTVQCDLETGDAQTERVKDHQS